MELIYGTSNPAKITYMKEILQDTRFRVSGVNRELTTAIKIDESGKSPLENAQIKSLAYYHALNKPVFSCDSGLYFPELPKELQPETHVRRVGGKELTDEEMIAYYSSLANQYGGKILAQYRNAISLVINPDIIIERMDDSLASEAFYLCDTPHQIRREGFPLDSLSLEIESSAYYLDISGLSKNLVAERGFRTFFLSAF